LTPAATPDQPTDLPPTKLKYFFIIKKKKIACIFYAELGNLTRSILQSSTAYWA